MMIQAIKDLIKRRKVKEKPPKDVDKDIDEVVNDAMEEIK